jgi:hypothetical protein
MKLNCPRCKKETDTDGNPYRPFCSERCKLIDLGNWVSGTYRIPEKPAPEEGEDSSLPEGFE